MKATLKRPTKRGFETLVIDGNEHELSLREIVLGDEKFLSAYLQAFSAWQTTLPDYSLTLEEWRSRTQNFNDIENLMERADPEFARENKEFKASLRRERMH